MNETKPETVSPAWVGGIDLRTARGADWDELMRRAHHDPTRLQQIAKARGFRPGWVWHALRTSSQNKAARRWAKAADHHTSSKE
jgi:hypothetical protein